LVQSQLEQTVLESLSQKIHKARHQWLIPIILATQEEELRGLRFKANTGK
jgi:hypothetical protein